MGSSYPLKGLTVMKRCATPGCGVVVRLLRKQLEPKPKRLRKARGIIRNTAGRYIFRGHRGEGGHDGVAADLRAFRSRVT